MRLYDAHNHLQDERLTSSRQDALERLKEVGVARMVVNGSCEEDWPDVLALAQQTSIVLPSFGYHPWYVHRRTPDWQPALVSCLDRMPSAVGEIGLDRWILEKPRKSSVHVASMDEQAEVFTWQLRLAANRNLPASIHCLQAWGRLYDILRDETLPACGFLLHSYGGPVEMVRPLADLGAYFSLPGYFAHLRKQRQRDVFKKIPVDRLLIETDAPDQCLPEERNRFPLTDAQAGSALNHPANIAAVYDFAAELRGETVEQLADRVEANFLHLFGHISRPPESGGGDVSSLL